MITMIYPKKAFIISSIIILAFLALFLHSPSSYADGIISATIPNSSLSTTRIPDFSDDPIIELQNNIPKFKSSQLSTECFVFFSPLDNLGRTGTGYACLGKETLAKSTRGAIGNIQPSGWHTIRYDDLIEDRYLYNRSHVIGFYLSGDNATAENLFTGTRFLNATSMLQFETSVAQYIERTDNHVLYRVTPRYHGKDLVAFGVQMEAYSVEDLGEGICFNVFLYNIQPGIQIDYRTGKSERAAALSNHEESFDQLLKGKEVTYVFNNNSRKFHQPSCPSVIEMKPKNREYFYGSREEALALGYEPCGACKP